MIINRRFIVLDTPGSSLEPISVKSVIVRFNEGDGSFRDASISEASVDAYNHQFAIQAIAKLDFAWPEAKPLTQKELERLINIVTEEKGEKE